MKRLTAAMVACLLSLLAVSCAPSGQGEGGGVTFTDSLGNHVVLAEEPQRVAALLGSYAEG